MAPPTNPKTLSLCSLFSVLLLFMHVQGSNAREMKVEEELPKQNEASPVSKEDDSYTASYKAAYTSNKHIHPSQHQASHVSHQPYLTGYIHSQKKEDDSYTASYKAAYTSNKHIHPSQHQASHVSHQPYLTGYIHSQKEEDDSHTASYKAAYTSNKRVDQPYITQYGNGKRVNQPYITQYGNGKRVNQPYITGYTNHKKENQPYITSYGADKRVSPLQEDHQENFESTNLKEQLVDSNINPRLWTQHGDGKKDSKVSIQDSKDSYATTYGKVSKDSYAATYGKESKNSYAATYGKDSKNSYSATYGKDSKNSYIATYRKNSEDTYAATYKVDHTEAFKTGFFTLDDLYVGNRMTLQFPVQEFPRFLTKKEADSIPFSTSQLPSVLQLLSIPQDSPDGEAMKGTLEQCELEPLTGETKVCVSSLESMIDFVRSIISSGSQLDILTTTLPTTSSVPLQNFTVLEISPDVYSPKWVACHPLPYPYAVFYCHHISTGSKIFKIRLGSEKGEQMEALGICHLDTSEWIPDHILFKRLGIKPGEAPVCHFFPLKHLMWVPLPSKATM